MKPITRALLLEVLAETMEADARGARVTKTFYNLGVPCCFIGRLHARLGGYDFPAAYLAGRIRAGLGRGVIGINDARDWPRLRALIENGPEVIP